MASNNKFNLTLVIFFAIFLLSGFSGLIYESIWSRYLKLFLGHASYAQMLVLIIFMGGMAIGSAIAAKLTFKVKNLILAYGIAEGIIGIFGLLFHNLFTTASDFTFNTLIVGLDSPTLITFIKFLTASLIILPQSILLGATFPLISGGIVNRYPDNPGQKLSTLYFLNSFGASLGILFNAFYLVPKLGLPGAALTAGLLNIIIAIAIYGLSKSDSYPVTTKKIPLSTSNTARIFIIIAFVTGLASFMYEIAWIRMLSMVLGASTDAFEIMLSAFILGLALGALFIRKKIDALQNPIFTLAKIQVVMGLFAALTLPFYNYTYEILATFKNSLTLTESGYIFFNITSYFICIVIMLPATICAGMTLPLITHILLKKYQSQSSIGLVYSANTIGAIIGVLISVQIIMPLLGLKPLLLIAALFDISLGLFLLYKYKYKSIKYISSVALTFIFVLSIFSSLDFIKMSSGVFRHGSLAKDEDRELLFHSDGKTSTVSVYEAGGYRVISNNGKPDAAINYNLNSKGVKLSSFDEPTMKLLGTLPFVYKPDAKLVANIGFGSGLTAETVLKNASVKKLDTIEIEQKVIDASAYFEPYVKNVHLDPRSDIIIDDAKTYFTSNNKQYDAIISEPPNPWVSGVSSLFTKEFYSLIKSYLQKDGIFVQWIHLYETNPNLIASVYKSLRTQFSHAIVYQVSNGDIAFVASNKPLEFSYTVIEANPDLSSDLALINLKNELELKSRKIAETPLLDSYFYNFEIPENSDYFPILENSSPKARFMKQTGTHIYELSSSRLLHKLLNQDYFIDNLNVSDIISETKSFPKAQIINSTQQFSKYFFDIQNINFENFNKQEFREVRKVKYFLSMCKSTNNAKLIDKLSNDIEISIATQFQWININVLKAILEEIKNQCTSLPKSTKLFVDALHNWIVQPEDAVIATYSKQYLLQQKRVVDINQVLILKLLLTSAIQNPKGIDLSSVFERVSFNINLHPEYIALLNIYQQYKEQS